jgi:hypothetical protein
MARRNKEPKLYAYLNELGLLKSTDKALIDAAKRQYWNIYKRNWQQQKRAEQKSFTVFFNSKEFGVITEGAKRHSLTEIAMVKNAALAYLKQTFLTLDTVSTVEIKQTLAFDEEKVSVELGNKLLEKVEGMERAILTRLEASNDIGI